MAFHSSLQVLDAVVRACFSVFRRGMPTISVLLRLQQRRTFVSFHCGKRLLGLQMGGGVEGWSECGVDLVKVPFRFRASSFNPGDHYWLKTASAPHGASAIRTGRSAVGRRRSGWHHRGSLGHPVGPRSLHGNSLW